MPINLLHYRLSKMSVKYSKKQYQIIVIWVQYQRKYDRNHDRIKIDDTVNDVAAENTMNIDRLVVAVLRSSISWKTVPPKELNSLYRNRARGKLALAQLHDETHRNLTEISREAKTTRKHLQVVLIMSSARCYRQHHFYKPFLFLVVILPYGFQVSRRGVEEEFIEVCYRTHGEV